MLSALTPRSFTLHLLSRHHAHLQEGAHEDVRRAELAVLAEGVFVPALELDCEPRCDSLFIIRFMMRQLDVGA
jgi:hypothetical protein